MVVAAPVFSAIARDGIMIHEPSTESEAEYESGIQERHAVTG